MKITFYSPHLKLTPAFIQKTEKSIERVIDKVSFLRGPKERQQDSFRIKVTAEKIWEWHHLLAGRSRPAEAKEGGNFKLTIELIFANQIILVADKGNDLYSLIGSVQQKLERKVRRYHGKLLKQEKRGAQLWKKLRIRSSKNIVQKKNKI